MAEVLERFPLFPLGIVLLPGETTPLHIFEERYKTMIGECLELGGEFGIVWLAGEGLRRVGCTTGVPELLERSEDGRMNIAVHGGRPFRLVRRVDDLAYPAGDIELLEDEPPSDDPEAADAAREQYAELVERATDSRPSDDELLRVDAYAMAAGVDLALEAKQELLELRDPTARFRRIAQLLAETARRIDYAERAGELARSNGRARPGRP